MTLPQIRISKSETIHRNANLQTCQGVVSDFVSDFVLRISDFGWDAAPEVLLFMDWNPANCQ
jgi:hypothetical protein